VSGFGRIGYDLFDEVDMPTKSCLLIEDRVDDALLVKKHMPSREDLALHWVMDGEEAVQYLERKGGFQDVAAPDLIVLDLRLPGMDGFKFLEWCRSAGPNPRTPVMVLSVSGVPEDLRRAQSLGVTSYLTKPVNWKRFEEEITALTAGETRWFDEKAEGRFSEKRVPKPRRVAFVLTFRGGKKVTVEARANHEDEEVPFRYAGDTSLFRPFAPSGTIGFLKWYVESIAANAGADVEFFENFE